ncbi:hypothetical protein pb186bvf_017801 [Paramecium bursaria]
MDNYQSWIQQRSQVAHKSRLQKTKGSNYLDLEKMKMIDKIVSFRIRAKERDKLIQNKEIHFQNEILNNRIMRISSVETKRNSQRLLLLNAKRELSQQQNEKMLEKENKLILERINNVVSNLDQKQFISDFKKHKMLQKRLTKYKQNMSYENDILYGDNLYQLHSQPNREKRTQSTQELVKTEQNTKQKQIQSGEKLYFSLKEQLERMKSIKSYQNKLKIQQGLFVLEN